MIQHQHEHCGSDGKGLRRAQWGGMSRLRRRFLGAAVSTLGLGLAISAVVGGCSSAPESRQTPAASAVHVDELPMNSFATEWRAELSLGTTQLRTLALNDDHVFACTSDNRCYWLSRSQGGIVVMPEVARPQDALFAPVTLTDRVVFPSTTRLMIYDRKGKFTHTVSLRHGACSGGVGLGTALYIGTDHTNGGRLSAIDTNPQPYDVSTLWDLMTREAISATPALFQNMLFMGSRDGGVYAVRADDRAGLWPGLDDGYFKTGGPILANIKVDKDGVYAASVDSKLYCLDMNTGRLKWSYYAGNPLREESTPVPTANTVYIYVPGTGLAAIDKAGRQEIRSAKWIVAEGRQYLAADENYIYARGNDNSVLAVDKQSGQVIFRSKRTDLTLFATNPGTKDNLIYAASANGTVLAIKPVLKPGSVGELVLNARPIEPVALNR